MKNILVYSKSSYRYRSYLQKIENKRYLDLLCAHTYRKAKLLTKRKIYDLVVLIDEDFGPDCKQFIEQLNLCSYTSKVMLLSDACRESQKKIQALESGADDCLEIPSDPREFELKIDRLIFMQKVHPKRSLKTANISLNPDNGTLTYKKRQINLRKKEFLILFHLIRHKNSIVSREMLAEYIWGDRSVSKNLIDVNIRRIRRILGEDQDILQTVWGFGYRIVDQ